MNHCRICNGKELHDALNQGCIEDCRSCKLVTLDNKCLLKNLEKIKKNWEEDHIQFHNSLEGYEG